ncbi:amiloride sensitive sodium channel family [Trichuris trichiura]|uniref:Amiloride sensitive sodium channel family n=1 Tax=Trichuris trichiura TaxID=36087 RepID=A0A077YVI1_TRITR|nr:amiloride sensitive sodium channel family [Trichuris trichiura]
MYSDSLCFEITASALERRHKTSFDLDNRLVGMTDKDGPTASPNGYIPTTPRQRLSTCKSDSNLKKDLNGKQAGEKVERNSAISKVDNSFKELNLSGIQEYSKSNTRYGKLFWIILIIIAIAGSCYEVYKILDHYYNCPIVTEWSVKATRAIEFPKIEICLPTSIGRKKMEEDPVAVAIAMAMKEKLLYTNFGERKQHVPGQGLVLVLNAQNQNYPVTKGLIPKVEGLILSIHHDYTPYSFNYFNIPTAMYTRLGLQAEFHEYLDVNSGPKAQPCVSDDEKNFTVLNVNYTVAGCQMDCFQALTLRECGCLIMQDTRLVLPEAMRKARFCSRNDVIECVNNRVTNSNDTQAEYEECCDKCHTACSLWNYNVQASSMGLYAPSFDFLSNYNLSLESLVYLQVAHTSLEYTKVGQEWATEIDNLIADFGGQVGLWIGGNLITFIQIPLLLLIFSSISLYERFKGMRKVRRAISQRQNLWSTIIDAERGGTQQKSVD